MGGRLGSSRIYRGVGGEVIDTNPYRAYSDHAIAFKLNVNFSNFTVFCSASKSQGRCAPIRAHITSQAVRHGVERGAG